MKVSHRQKKNILYGIRASLTRRKIRKYHRKLGNGHDLELHLTIADLYKHLGKHSLAVESYRLSASSLLKNSRPLDISGSDRLIHIYKQILALSPYDDEIAHKLGQEYQRRGMEYRAISLHTLMAERYVRQGEYHKAIRHYQQVCIIEPGSIAARVACANLYRQLAEYEEGAKEYTKIGDIYFKHQKFDGALKYYQQAAEFSPDDEGLREKVCMTQQILEGTLVPQEQENWQNFSKINQETASLKQSLVEKERIEQQLRHDIALLEQRYWKAVMLKNKQLQAARERLEKLSTYVAVFKDNLENISLEKQRLQEQLEAESAHKTLLEQKLTKLCSFDLQMVVPVTRTEQAKQLTSAITRLGQEKIELEQRLQERLNQSIRHEFQLRNKLENQEFKGSQFEQQLAIISRERQQIEQRARYQLQESLQKEQILQEQMKQRIGQHEQTMQQVEQEKQNLAQKYRTAQEYIHAVEEQNITMLEQLQGELSRQCELECSFSQQFRESLGEITSLLHNQEQEIQKLLQLQP